MKRNSLLREHKVKKRRNEKLASDDDSDDNDIVDIPSDVKILVALQTLYALIPADLSRLLPRLVLHHQLYSFLRNRTAVDRQLTDLKTSKQIIMLRFSSSDVCICDRSDYIAHLRSKGSDLRKLLLEKFIEKVAKDIVELSVSRELMFQRWHFIDDDITKLIRSGWLVIRDGNSWWLSVRGMAAFTGRLYDVRKQLLKHVKKSKYKELLQQDLETRSVKGEIINMKYHIHDLIGGEFVDRIDTPMGTLLRYEEADEDDDD